VSYLQISFDVASVQRIARLAGATALLRDTIAIALHDGAELIINTSQSNMNWANPTGKLENSMDILSEAPFELTLGSDLPYARRREQGFHGADSLGRIYNDYGAFFLSDAVDMEETEVLGKIDDAIEEVLSAIAR